MKTKHTLTYHTLAGLALLAILATAPAIAEEVPAKEESAKLQGMWTVTTLEAGGNHAPAGAVKGMRYLIKGDKISLTGKAADLRRVRMNATATPKEIDIFDDANNEFSKGIYEIDGDMLKLCFSQSTKLDRPKSFDTGGTKYMCFTLKLAQP